MAEQEEPPYEQLFTAGDRPSQHNAYVHTSDVSRISQQGVKVDGCVPVKEAGLSKQTSLLHQSSSYLKQATGGLMRWQSRRAFWSAVDSSGAQSPGVTAACGNKRSAIAFWFKMVWEVSLRHPSVLVAPLLLLSACIVGGLCGVILAANNSEQRALDDTRTLAWQVASSFQVLTETNGLQPAAALASLAREHPGSDGGGEAAAGWGLGQALPALAPRLLKQQQPTSATTPIRQILLAPFGTVNSTYSPPPAVGVVAAPGSGMFSVGDNLWDKSAGPVESAVRNRLPVLATVVTDSTANGSPTTKDSPEVLLVVYHPVYVTGVGAGETWGHKITGGYSTNICANDETACYDARSGTKLWGFAVVVVSLSSLASSPDAGMQGLAEGSYHYRLAVQPSGAATAINLATSVPPPKITRGMDTAVVLLTGPRTTAVVGTAMLDVLLDHDDGYQTSWEGPLIAVVIVVSLALSAFFFAVLFNYWRHMNMLKAMLPEKVIQVLGTGSNYYQHFDCVTVLYADVVRYTAATHQQGDTVPTLEVVKLLNAVHAMYESIIEKYGLVRIRRSGESFLCVGGCPIPDDPVAVAVRVAACARDLLLATSRFRGVGGFRVQIRLGLHSGPAVAAVVGSKMPRFSLFGDVVDMSYYMEATSRAMAIHVSDRTSQLLMTANDPLLQLTPRGPLDIIGQGSMNTSWLKLDQMPELPGRDEEELRQSAATAMAARVQGTVAETAKKGRGGAVGETSQTVLLPQSPKSP